MSKNTNYRRGNRRSNNLLKLLIVFLVLIVIFGIGLFVYPKLVKDKDNQNNNNSTNIEGNGGDNSGDDNNQPSNPDENVDNSENQPGQSEEDEKKEEITKTLEEAKVLALGYDYEKAIKQLEAVEGYETIPEIVAAIDSYKTSMESLVEWEDIGKISHVFFHTLIVDTDKAFDGDASENGYNQVMTTVDEFNKTIKQMYDRGYVLVSLHDMASFVENEDGTKTMTKGKIMLPEGKIPFVLSQDDVSYYEYMDGDGFASKLIIGEDGRVTNEMILDDGSVVTGSYDVLPLLEDFIKEHPDFSYRGARGILALTGYNGVFGYRTSPSGYADSPTLQADIEKAKEIAEAIKAQGWEFASHGWGHRDLGSISYSHFQRDTDKWESEVESILGETDILIYPFGGDIGDWREYKGDRYKYLTEKGFSYFCNVDGSAQYWVQLTDDYLRQGRMNIDGIRMYEDLYGGKKRLAPFIDVESVFDKARPLPVPSL